MDRPIKYCLPGILVLIAFSAVEGFACSCAPPIYGEPLSKQVRAAKASADAIFAGEVLSISEHPAEGYVSVELRVASSWKGNLTKKLTILTGLHDGNCRYPFKVGETYLVYASNTTMYSRAVSSLETTICQRTALFSEGKSDIRFLGAKKKILTPPRPS